MAVRPVGGGGTTVTIPGDPKQLQLAAKTYNEAGHAMADTAGKLRNSVGAVADWEGAGARAHATRAQALAAAHQVAADAFNSAAGALATYAIELEAAQKLAQQANEAWATAGTTSLRLANVLADETTASRKTSRDLLGLSPYDLYVSRADELQSALTDQQIHASNLANQAVTLADTAGTKAALAFQHVAEMAGNPADHGGADPFQAYLGTTSHGQAAALIQAGYNLGGIPVGSDTRALGDLAADPGAGSSNRRLARLYERENHDSSLIVAKDFSYLRNHGVKHPLPANLASLSPDDKAALLSKDVLYVKHHQHSGGLIFGLHLVSLVFGMAAAGLTFASLLQGGLDFGTDAGAIAMGEAAVDGAGGGVAAGSADGAEVAAESDEVAPEVAKALRTLKLNVGATAFGLGGVGADVTTGEITGHWDYPQLVLDTAAFVPGIGAVATDLKVLGKTQEIVAATDQLSEMSRGTEAYAQLSRELAAAEANKIPTEVLAQLLAAKSFSIGTGGWVFSAATLGAPSS